MLLLGLLLLLGLAVVGCRGQTTAGEAVKVSKKGVGVRLHGGGHRSMNSSIDRSIDPLAGSSLESIGWSIDWTGGGRSDPVLSIFSDLVAIYPHRVYP